MEMDLLGCHPWAALTQGGMAKHGGVQSVHVVATDKLRGDGTSAALMESSPNTPVQQVGDLHFLWQEAA